MTDVLLLDQGTLIGFTPASEAAQDWFLHHVQSEDWQWLGSTLWVDQRLARDLLEGIVNVPLTVGINR